MTSGQKAMAYAFIYPDPEKGGRGKKTVVIYNSFDRRALRDLTQGQRAMIAA
jgi:hypothetical protein